MNEKFETTEEHLKEIEFRKRLLDTNKNNIRSRRYNTMLFYHAENLLSLARDGLKWREHMKELDNLDVDFVKMRK